MIRTALVLLITALGILLTQAVGTAGTPVKVVFDPKDARIRGFVEVLEKRGVKLVHEQSAKPLQWRIVEPQFPGGELRVGICTFKDSATEAQMREALSDFSGGWRHVNSHSRLAMSRIHAAGFEKGKPDDIAALEEKLRVAFFWHQRPETRPLKNALTNEVVDAGQDPKDERIVALVAYLGRNGIKLKDSPGWRIVEPKHTDGIISVSIRSLPPPATEVQMRFGLDVNLYYELNVEAQLAMSRLIFTDSKDGKAPAGLESKLLRLFHEYRPAGAPSTEKAAKARDQLVKFLSAQDIDLRPVPNSTNVIQGLYSIGPDHDKQFCIGLNYLPPKTADAFRKEHVGYPFAHEIRGNCVLFKVGDPNGIKMKGYDGAWKKVLAAIEEYSSFSPSHDRYLAYWLASHPPDPKSHEYEPLLLITRMPIEVLARHVERWPDSAPPDELLEKKQSGKKTWTVQLLDGLALTIETHHKDSIWNPDGHPIKHLQSISKVRWQDREAIVNGKNYRYEVCPLADVIRLLDRPEGTMPIHRLHGPLTGYEQTAKALSLLLREQLAADREVWTKSDDGRLAVLLAVTPTKVKPGDDVEITVKVRNLSDKPIMIPRPFGHPGYTYGLGIQGPKGQLGYHGFPPPRQIEEWYRVGGIVIRLEPGKEFKDSCKLNWSNYPELRTRGTYRFTSDLSYRKGWDAIEDRVKVKLWRGKFEELRVMVEVQDDEQPKPKEARPGEKGNSDAPNSPQQSASSQESGVFAFSGTTRLT